MESKQLSEHEIPPMYSRPFVMVFILHWSGHNTHLVKEATSSLRSVFFAAKIILQYVHSMRPWLRLTLTGPLVTVSTGFNSIRLEVSKVSKWTKIHEAVARIWISFPYIVDPPSLFSSQSIASLYFLLIWHMQQALMFSVESGTADLLRIGGISC